MVADEHEGIWREVGMRRVGARRRLVGGVLEACGSPWVFGGRWHEACGSRGWEACII